MLGTFRSRQRPAGSVEKDANCKGKHRLGVLIFRCIMTAGGREKKSKNCQCSRCMLQGKGNKEMASHLISSQAQQVSVTFLPSQISIYCCVKKQLCFAMPCYTMLTHLLAAPLLAPLVGIAPGHAINRVQVVSTYQHRVIESSNTELVGLHFAFVCQAIKKFHALLHLHILHWTIQLVATLFPKAQVFHDLVT